MALGVGNYLTFDILKVLVGDRRQRDDNGEGGNHVTVEAIEYGGKRYAEVGRST